MKSTFEPDMDVDVFSEPREGPAQGSVLLVDDDASVRCALHLTLKCLGFTANEASHGEEALDLARGNSYDIVLLDIKLPGMNGLQICRELRRLFPRLVIIMLTVQDSLEEKVAALEAGADDYITKPFHLRELTARLRAALRRAHAFEGDSAVIRIGEIELDTARREMQKNGVAIHLTRKEFDLMYYLMSHAGLPIAHEKLLNAVWGPEHGQEVEYLRTFVRQLRKKIEDNPANPKYLITAVQVGYRFRQPENGLHK